MIGAHRKMSSLNVRSEGIQVPDDRGTLYLCSRLVSLGGDQGLWPVENCYPFRPDLFNLGVAHSFLLRHRKLS